MGAYLLFFHGVLTMLLALPLKRRFDADWKKLAPDTGGPLLRRYHLTLRYMVAVVSRRAARNTFPDETYDFRGRVGPLLYLLCWVSTGTACVALTLMVGGFIIEVLAGHLP
jgi:hypothetical protein